MPAGVVDAPNIIGTQETDIIRAALHRMTDHDRRQLWQCLDVLDRAIGRGYGIGHALQLAPSGIVRDTVVQVARLRVTDAPPPAAGTRAIPALGYTPVTLTTVVGRAADPDCWTAGWCWQSFSPDALADVADRSRRAHRPVEVRYRHLAGSAIGLTRHWQRCEDGGLDVELMLLPTDRAQYAGRCMRDGSLRGLSLGVRVEQADWTHLHPDEWEPAAQRLDLMRRHEITPCEISVTPWPAQGDHAHIRAVW